PRAQRALVLWWAAWAAPRCRWPRHMCWRNNAISWTWTARCCSRTTAWADSTTSPDKSLPDRTCAGAPELTHHDLYGNLESPLFVRHSGAGRNPFLSCITATWIPAFAGMTVMEIHYHQPGISPER